ncbi:hypothetical protein [Arachidicoccus terrestris]|uniref:hypothetical protein n=1 Tax=Arachidicoccus terrestris TaxID=2875539 RepID=UPI001CC371DE|nr:hypothetical protein [Arachidicoccus terrestris]UAY55744.1 hypothetical protein K9M52_01540 [Arachidicoccus terrestris]
MARKRASTFQVILPLLKRMHVGVINRGLVDGETQAKYVWDEPVLDGSEPKLWFHDIFRKDGSSFDKDETEFIRTIIKQK